jgi:hypothetical protein
LRIEMLRLVAQDRSAVWRAGGRRDFQAMKQNRRAMVESEGE